MLISSFSAISFHICIQLRSRSLCSRSKITPVLKPRPCMDQNKFCNAEYTEKLVTLPWCVRLLLLLCCCCYNNSVVHSCLYTWSQPKNAVANTPLSNSSICIDVLANYVCSFLWHQGEDHFQYHSLSRTMLCSMQTEREDNARFCGQRLYWVLRSSPSIDQA